MEKQYFWFIFQIHYSIKRIKLRIQYIIFKKPSCIDPNSNINTKISIVIPKFSSFWAFFLIQIILMNISKSESYNLSPDQYLDKFQKPHSIISSKGKQEKYEEQISILEAILEKYNENTLSQAFKQKAISQLKEVVEKWIHLVVEEWKNEKHFEGHSIKQSTFQNVDLIQLGYGLKIFGSYSLKTNSFDGDIDMICVVPEFFSRERHFYSILTEELKKHSNFKEVFAIPDAIVPLIKMSIYDIQIDLLVSRIPINFLRQNPKFFEGEIRSMQTFVNDKELRSINGFRTSVYLQKNIKNYKNYQVVLKTIKMWAKNKGIYSQIYGYLGGAALSIMLAKIFQLYPNYSPLQLIDRFFFIYANWVWTLAVKIQQCSIDEKVDGGMLIFTPLQPHMNAAHYVSRITCHITRKHLRLASKLIQDINKKKKDWKDLFKPLDFFNTYYNFIELSVMGEKQQEFIVWKGNIESKLRKFIKYLQNQIENLQLIQIHPYPSYFVSKHPNYKYCYKYYFGIKCESNPNLNDYCQIDITPSVRSFLQLLQSYNGIQKVPKQINIGFAHVEKSDIDKEILQGIKMY